MANPTYYLVISIINPGGSSPEIPPTYPYIGVVDRGKSNDPVSGTNVFTNSIIAGLGATNNGDIQKVIDKVLLQNFDINPDFTYNPVFGPITLLIGNEFYTGSTL